MFLTSIWGIAPGVAPRIMVFVLLKSWDVIPQGRPNHNHNHNLPKKFCIWCHTKTAFDGTSDEKSLWFLCVPLCRRDIWCVIQGYPKNEKWGPREMNSKMVVVVVGPSINSENRISYSENHREVPVRFGSVTVWEGNGSSGSGFRFWRFLCKKGLSVFQFSLTGKDGSSSSFGSWTTVPGGSGSASGFGKKRFWRFRFPVPVRFLSHPWNHFLSSESCSKNAPELSKSSENGLPQESFRAIFNLKRLFWFFGFIWSTLRKCTVKQGKICHFQGYFSIFGLPLTQKSKRSETIWFPNYLPPELRKRKWKSG